jgi:hypothetical protein
VKNIVILISIFASSAFADTALTVRLRKSDSYDRIYEKITTPTTDPQLNEISKKIKAAWEAQKELDSDPSARAKMYYQEDVNAKPCSSCPKYLDLILEVNKIVEKTKDQDIQSSNEKMIALTKLKFLYYTVKSTDIMNRVTCKTYNPMLPAEKDSYEHGSLTLAAEKALVLPNVNSVQYYEGSGKEVHYFYKGEGAEADNVIEVVMMPDGKAIMKYYKYDNGFNFHVSGQVLKEKATAEKKDDFIEFNPTFEIQNFVLPTDINFGSFGTKYSITDTLDLKNKTEVAFNKQVTSISLVNKDGNKYVVVDGQNITDGKKKVDGIVNYDLVLDKESNLKLGAGVSHTIETMSEKFSDGISNKQAVRLGLTDFNNEYIKVKTLVDAQGVSSVAITNKYKVGEGSIGAGVELMRDGSKNYKVDMLNQSYIKAAGISYKEDMQGFRTYGVNSGFTVDKTLQFSTGYSRSDTNGQGVTFNFQKKVSENASMVLTLGQSEKNGSSLMYQFQSKF